MVDDAIFMSKGRTLGDEASAMVAEAKTKYRIDALDRDLLISTLRGSSVPVEETPTGVVVRIDGDTNAAEALAWLVSKGVRVHRFGPVGSALEQTYMAMNEERR
ncbi:hypothetical protein [Demequina litorisediminis]|uniref:ABC transporter ATP-binding protein n=2 Tax=Demequina TaxID=577469 RepID=A0ABQ6IE38_9MICO|nr:hypothetical protein GCM10025876_21780 [Demequina litorisediminis]